MGFRINTNIAAMNSHRNALQTNAGLDKSLNSLSSGLRINTAADDASGMTIADSLRSQAQGLGQAINNANDGVAVVQTADGALDEYINILNSVRTKSIQAASDGQNADSRKAIQADIDRLLEAADGIATQTQFNGQKLLDGTFTNKSFHVGAYASETVGLSVGSVRTDSVGDITSVSNNTGNGNLVDGTATWAALSGGNFTATSSGNVLKADILKVNGFDISSSLNTLSPTRLQDAQSVAKAITAATGLTAQGTTIDKGNTAITASALSDTDYLKINGVQVENVTYSASDADGSLTRAINDISDLTGVTAAVVGGKLELTAQDGRNIAVGVGGVATNTGLTDTTTKSASTTLGTLASSAAAAVTIAEGALIINGVDMAGTYGNGTSGSAGIAFQAALRDISGMEDSTVSAAGAIVMNVNDGQDLNIAGTAAATYAPAAGITNSSEKGVIDIFSSEKVTIAGTETAAFGFDAGGFTPRSNNISLESINVLDRNSAEVAILITDSALKQLDATRSDLGSVQNQLESTIRNISVTQVNVTSAESQIRDVDFAKESAQFAKLNILAQSGSYAMSQANAVQQNVMRLLQ